MLTPGSSHGMTSLALRHSRRKHGIHRRQLQALVIVLAPHEAR